MAEKSSKDLRDEVAREAYFKLLSPFQVIKRDEQGKNIVARPESEECARLAFEFAEIFVAARYDADQPKR